MQNPPMFMLANSSASVIASINAHYHYTPQTFHNGNGEDCVISPAGMEQDAKARAALQRVAVS